MKACLCGLSRCECHTQLIADCLGCDLIKELMSSFCVLVTQTPMCSYSHIYTDSFFISIMYIFGCKQECFLIWSVQVLVPLRDSSGPWSRLLNTPPIVTGVPLRRQVPANPCSTSLAWLITTDIIMAPLTLTCGITYHLKHLCSLIHPSLPQL